MSYLHCSEDSKFNEKNQLLVCSTDDKNLETEIGVQPKNQESKAAKPLEKSFKAGATINKAD